MKTSQIDDKVFVFNYLRLFQLRSKILLARVYDGSIRPWLTQRFKSIKIINKMIKFVFGKKTPDKQQESDQTVEDTKYPDSDEEFSKAYLA